MRVILIALTAVMLSTVSYAQKVIKDGDAVIIDCSEMSSKFYTSVPKALTTQATVSESGPNDLNNLSSEVSNQLVYKKFEVHKTDHSASVQWLDAMQICPSLNSNGVGWRFPTQRESMLIFILHEKLVANGLSPLDKVAYWCATTVLDTPNHSWTMSLKYDYIVNAQKNREWRGFVRCIRDIIDK